MNEETHKKQIDFDKWLFIFFLLVVILLGLALVFYYPQQEGYVYKVEPASTNSYVGLQQDFPELNFTTQINLVIETILDIIWDVDGSSNFAGILPLAYSYLPVLGENGTVFTNVIFIFSVTIFIILLAKRLRAMRGG